MDLHSDESVERAAITLRGITQELRGRGISAVMLLEEQIKALEEFRKDAERWRWLRAQHTYDGEGDSDITRWYVQAGREPVPCDPGALDAEIDAAMAERGSVGAA